MARHFYITLATHAEDWSGHRTIGQHYYFWTSADVGDAHLLDTEECATGGRTYMGSSIGPAGQATRCASVFACHLFLPKEPGWLTVCRETQNACLRLKTGQSSTTQAALKVTRRCRTKVEF